MWLRLALRTWSPCVAAGDLLTRLLAMAWFAVDGGEIVQVVGTAFGDVDDVVNLIGTGLSADVADAAVAAHHFGLERVPVRRDDPLTGPASAAHAASGREGPPVGGSGAAVP